MKRTNRVHLPYESRTKRCLVSDVVNGKSVTARDAVGQAGEIAVSVRASDLLNAVCPSSSSSTASGRPHALTALLARVGAAHQAGHGGRSAVSGSGSRSHGGRSPAHDVAGAAPAADFGKGIDAKTAWVMARRFRRGHRGKPASPCDWAPPRALPSGMRDELGHGGRGGTWPHHCVGYPAVNRRGSGRSTATGAGHDHLARRPPRRPWRRRRHPAPARHRARSAKRASSRRHRPRSG
jgi:hypothetical protein